MWDDLGRWGRGWGWDDIGRAPSSKPRILGWFLLTIQGSISEPRMSNKDILGLLCEPGLGQQTKDGSPPSFPEEKAGGKSRRGRGGGGGVGGGVRKSRI